MNVLIIGGGGFLGSRLAKVLANKGGLVGGPIRKITLVDVSFNDQVFDDDRIVCLKGDFSERSVISPVLEDRPDLIFHLAAIVSGEAEKNFELGMKVNFHGSLQLLETCRVLGYKPRIVFSSSCGVFGGDVTQEVTDAVGPKPRSSYGTQKAITELLINDYSRRGFIDGRSVRLPTITVRPGKPNAATSSFLSGIIREPLHGIQASYPVTDDSAFWLLSPRQVIRNFIHAANIEEQLLGDDRMITLPGLTVSVGELIDGLRKVAGEEVANLITYEPDEFLQSIVLTWPPHFIPARALQLGFTKDGSVEEIIRNYVEEEQIEGFGT